MIGKSTPASTPRPAKSPDRWAIFTFLALAQLMIVLDTTVMNIAMPSVQSELEMSDGERQWTITAYALSFGGLLLLGGRVTDLLGHKRAFLVGLVGFALASALGGLLTEYTTWRWTLYVAVPIAALSFAGVTTLLKARAVPERGRRLDVLGALLVTLGLGVLVHGFSLAQTHGWASPSPWACSPRGPCSWSPSWWPRPRVHAPLLPFRIVLERNRGGALFTLGRRWSRCSGCSRTSPTTSRSCSTSPRC